MADPSDPTGPAAPARGVAEARKAADAEEARAPLGLVQPVPNVLPFRSPGNDAKRPVLTAVERSAFHEIAKVLGSGDDDALPASPATVPEVAAEPGAQTAAAPNDAPPASPAAQADAGQAAPADLRAILDVAAAGILVVDAAGAVIEASTAAERLFDAAPGGLLGRSFLDVLDQESRKGALEYLDALRNLGIASVLRDGREVTASARGQTRTLTMRLERLPSEARYCVVFHDITRAKKAEAELTRAKLDAEQLSRGKSDYVTQASHEIRTPLNAIIGFSEIMIEERFGALQNERYREYLKDIHRSGRQLLSLVDNLLDLARIEAGKVDLALESLDLNELVADCVALTQPQANAEGVVVRVSLAPTLPEVVADAGAMRQIFLNLLSNAIKFTERGGQVIVSTAHRDGSEVTLRVRDTGIGMSAEQVATALKPFGQASGRSGGWGLGLPLAKALAEANRATLTIASEPGNGTLVEVAFPQTRILAG